MTELYTKLRDKIDELLDGENNLLESPNLEEVMRAINKQEHFWNDICDIDDEMVLFLDYTSFHWKLGISLEDQPDSVKKSIAEILGIE